VHYANLEREKARAAGASTSQAEAVYSAARAAEMSGQPMPFVDANLERQKALAAGASRGDAERIFSAARAVQVQQEKRNGRSQGSDGHNPGWANNAFWRWFGTLMFTWMREDENPAARGCFFVLALVVAAAVSIPMGFGLGLFGGVLLRAVWGLRIGGEVAITAACFISFSTLTLLFLGQRDEIGSSPTVRRWTVASVLAFIGALFVLQAYVESRPAQQQAASQTPPAGSSLNLNFKHKT
jgi:hypothetical protein